MIHTLFLFSLAFSIALILGWIASAWTLAVAGITLMRRVLVTVLVVSLSIALIPFLFPHSGVGQAELITSVIGYGEIDSIYVSEEVAPTLNLPVIDIFALCATIYIIGVAVMILYFLSGLGFMFWLRLTSKRTVVAGCYEVWCHRYSSFSPCCIGRWIFIPQSSYSDDEIRMICIHEYAHFSRYHWAETLLARLILAFEWYNPAAWRLCSALRDLHEYEADSDVLSAGINSQSYQMMLIKKAVDSRFHSLANSLNHSSLKKRITMMLKTKQSAWGAWMRTLALVPAFALALFAVQSPLFATVRPSEHVAVATADKVTENSPEPEIKGTIYDRCEVNPEYPGGVEAMYRFLVNNLKYPEAAVKNNVQGRVYIRFVVTSDGTLTDFSVQRGVSPELDAEALRVVKLFPKFTPGTIDGKPVNVYYSMPVAFKLNSRSSTVKK